jgi:hypothetical protein
VFPTVLAISKKFISFVESGPLLGPHDVVDLLQAEAADLGGGVEGGGPGNDVPGEVVRNVQFLQVPDVTT